MSCAGTDRRLNLGIESPGLIPVEIDVSTEIPGQDEIETVVDKAVAAAAHEDKGHQQQRQ